MQLIAWTKEKKASKVKLYGQMKQRLSYEAMMTKTVKHGGGGVMVNWVTGADGIPGFDGITTKLRIF